MRAAGEKAAVLGYEVIVDNACDDWPYDKAAAYLVDRLIELRRQHANRKLCLLSGGEVTVHIDRQPGTGGRNQQFALACALLLHERLRGQPVVCLSAGSDGADGNSPAAGSSRTPPPLRARRPSASITRAALKGSIRARYLQRSGTACAPDPQGITCAISAFLLHG